MRLPIHWKSKLVGHLEDIVAETIDFGQDLETVVETGLPNGKYRGRFVALDAPTASEFVGLLRKDRALKVSDDRDRQWLFSWDSITNDGWLITDPSAVKRSTPHPPSDS